MRKFLKNTMVMLSIIFGIIMIPNIALAGISPVGARIWAVKDTSLTDNNGNIVTHIKKGDSAVVTATTADALKVAYDGKEGLINKSLCMIEMQGIMQPEMQFDIANGESALYNVHGNKIPNVTGCKLYSTKIAACMYYVAVELYEVEEKALDNGYTLKIYDSYRPYSVTKLLYANASKVDYKIRNAYFNQQGYHQGWFLARGENSHNFGTAFDLTLVDMYFNREFEMQTKMHDLSYLSTVDKNTEAANTLRNLMTSEGFKPLKSEWWHFDLNQYKITTCDFQLE